MAEMSSKFQRGVTLMYGWHPSQIILQAMELRRVCHCIWNWHPRAQVPSPEAPWAGRAGTLFKEALCDLWMSPKARPKEQLWLCAILWEADWLWLRLLSLSVALQTEDMKCLCSYSSRPRPRPGVCCVCTSACRICVAYSWLRAE
jgi:hypothetical protein